MTITLADFRTIPFSVGGYNGALPGTNGPILRDSTAIATPLDPSAKHKHLIQTHPIPLSYRTAPSPLLAGQRHITFGDPAGGPPNDEAYYLPFVQQNISSMTIGTGCNRFFTDNLSGCSIFVDASPGQIVVYHANVFGGGFNAPEDKANDYGYERHLAVVFKKQMHDGAMAYYPGGATNRLQLFKSTYWGACNQAAKHSIGDKIKMKARVGGFGTTVAGFLNGRVWDFWWQTWESRNGTAKVIDSRSFGTVAI